MTIDTFRDFCLSLPAVEETFPFDEQTLVFKVGGKIFAITHVDEFVSINLKCDPEQAVELRERHPAVLPGYHMNKQHWNTVLIDGSIATRLLTDWIRHSYDLVVASLPRKTRLAYGL